MKKIILAIIFFLSSFANMIIACSNLAIKSANNTIVARTLDFEQNTGNLFGLGLVGQTNSSDLNLSHQAKGLQWKNHYNFMGQTGFGNPIIIDGINSAGLYAGYFYLGGVTQYPKYNRANKQPALGVIDVVNYILGSARSVKQAVKLLKDVQIVENAVAIDPNHKPGVFALMPLHILIRDVHDHSAVLEFIKGKTIITQNIGNVLTNTPNIQWQLNNAARYNYTKTNNTTQKTDGMYMSGSGFAGIPGDWTPPGRFARATQLLRHFPKPRNDNQAVAIACQGLASIETPLGTNPSPTLWETISNLRTKTYYFRPMIKIIDLKKFIYQTKGDGLNNWQHYNLTQISNHKKLPKAWLKAKIEPSHRITQLINLMHETDGPMKPVPIPILHGE